MECYVDDIIIKSSDQIHVRDLRECFQTLRKHQMKLNPSKCTFGVRLGKFLGYPVSQQGIESNLENIDAIINMDAPKTKREVQRLTGRQAALRCFISRGAVRSLTFFDTLRGVKDFV